MPRDHQNPVRRLGSWPVAASALLSLAVAPPTTAQSPASTSYVLTQDTIGSAGTPAVSASFVLGGTLSQESTVGLATSSGFVLESGFWSSASTAYALTVVAAGSGNGTLTGPGVACAANAGVATGDCAETLVHGSSLAVVAAADVNHIFDGWAGCDNTSTTTVPNDTCAVQITEARSITATFTALGTLGDLVWRDIDGDGSVGSGEPGIDGVTVSLSGPSGPQSTVTAAGGAYSFVDLYPGTYTVSVAPASLPPGVVPSFDADGIGTPHTATVVIGDGKDHPEIDFGYQPLVDLAITKVDDVDPLPGGQPLTYTITVENLGPGPATEVVVTDVLPTATSLVATSGCDEDPVGIPTCTIGDLGIGAIASVTVEVAVLPAPPAMITNTATVAGLETDLTISNNTESETTALDAVGPRVVLVDTVATTADGALLDCESVHGQPLEQLLVTFDEELANPAGDTELGDVTNPNSWLLVGPGPDGDLATTSCGTPALDDVVIPLVQVTWSSATLTAALDPGAPLEPGRYRLFACGVGSSVLQDLAGNPLDGDANGTSGDDFPLTFRADPDNKLANGHFDCDLGDWAMVSTNPAEIVFSTDDQDGLEDSGSAAIENLTASRDFGLGQCVPAEAETAYLLAASVRMATSAPGIGFALRCSFYASADCSGTALSTEDSVTFLGDTSGTWLRLGEDLTSPAAAASVLCSTDFAAPGGANFDARLDHVELSGPSLLFADGFESGDTSAWSATVP